jgi:hypothetical protein
VPSRLERQDIRLLIHDLSPPVAAQAETLTCRPAPSRPSGLLTTSLAHQAKVSQGSAA